MTTSLCAIAANAGYLVSEDAHLKVLRQVSFPKVNLGMIKK
jgi:hypothetical protein